MLPDIWVTYLDKTSSRHENCNRQNLIIDGLIDLLIDFNGISTRLGLSYG